MKRLKVVGLVGLQIAFIWRQIEGLADWRVGYNKYGKKPFISIDYKDSTGAIYMQFGRISEEVVSKIVSILNALGVEDTQIDIDDE